MQAKPWHAMQPRQADHLTHSPEILRRRGIRVNCAEIRSTRLDPDLSSPFPYNWFLIYRGTLFARGFFFLDAPFARIGKRFFSLARYFKKDQDDTARDEKSLAFAERPRTKRNAVLRVAGSSSITENHSSTLDVHVLSLIFFFFSILWLIHILPMTE